MWGHGLKRSGSGSGQVAGICECGDEPFRFHKTRGISWLAENRLVSQEGLWFME